MKWYWIVTIIVGAVALLLVLSNIFYKQFFKRFFDVILSGLALIFLSPLLLIMSIVGAIAMKGNPFFVQPRPGKIDPKTGKEKIFKLIKFRTMTNQKDKDGYLLPDEIRLNRYGRFIRTTSLDELPELWNILIGDMAIVGPRPLLIDDVACMNEVQLQRHFIRPGLTGLSQCTGRNSFDWDKKLATDIEYVKAISFSLDVKIIAMTVAKVTKREDIDFDTGKDISLKTWNELKQRNAEYDNDSLHT